MNERVPDSSGLPLRAMVMVLLFLGVIFLLLGWQALGSSGNSDDDSLPVSSMATTTAPSSTNSKPVPDAHLAEVRVYNISEQEGVAGRTADRLKAAGFKIADVGNLSLPDVAHTTVFYGNAAGERATADAVGQTLGVPVEPRIPELSDQLPGVVVAVTG